MNWRKEIDRISLDFQNVDSSSMIAYYKIGDIYFKVDIDYTKCCYDYETGRYSINIEIKDGVWWTDEDTTDKQMEFGNNYKEWMFSMIDFMMDEYDFLSEYTWESNDDDFNYWADYGI